MTTPRRPVMRYHGGKWRLAEWIISHMPRHRIYVEPFGGSASVLLQKPRVYAEVYNDVGDEVVNVFQVLRDPEKAAALEALLRLTPFSRREFELSYDRTNDPVERARRMIARSFMGYGSAGARRPDKTGFRARGFNQRTPSAIEWAKYPDEIRTFCDRLQGVLLECKPALEVIRGIDATDVLFYCDPPYVLCTRSSALDRRKHYAAEMTDEQHEELAEVLYAIKGMAIISGYRCELYDRLYADWVRFEKSARSMLNVRRIECIWLSPNVQAIQMKLEER